jgi:hypothetical protein
MKKILSTRLVPPGTSLSLAWAVTAAVVVPVIAIALAAQTAPALPANSGDTTGDTNGDDPDGRRDGAKTAYAQAVLTALGAFEGRNNLTTTLQVRVSDETAQLLDGIVAEANQNGIRVTRSDLVRVAINSLVNGTEAAQEALAHSA